MTKNPDRGPDPHARTIDAFVERVLQATDRAGSTVDLSELARTILEVVRDKVGNERGTLFVVLPGSGGLKSLVAQELDDEIRLPVGFGVAEAVAASGEALDIPSAIDDPRFDPSFDDAFGFQTRDIYCQPVRNQAGKVVGVLQLLNRTRALTADDQKFLADISVPIGTAIDTASQPGKS